MSKEDKELHVMMVTTAMLCAFECQSIIDTFKGMMREETDEDKKKLLEAMMAGANMCLEVIATKARAVAEGTLGAEEERPAASHAN